MSVFFPTSSLHPPLLYWFFEGIFWEIFQAAFIVVPYFFNHFSSYFVPFFSLPFLAFLSDSISSTIEGEQVVHSLTLIQNIQPSSTSQASSKGMCSLTLSGENLISLGLNASSNEFRNDWILDSGATDHMTHNLNQFKTYLPCLSNRKIVVADGTTTIVAGIGDVQVTSNLVLKDILHVPQLSTNLVSIQKLT